MAVGSWDGITRIYEITQQGTSKGLAMIRHQWPVLDTCWSADGQQCFSAGGDRLCKMLNVGTLQVSQIANHDGPIIGCRTVDPTAGPAANMLITTSWDKTVKV